MLFKLAFKNIKKSIKDYSIFFFTLVTAVCIFYAFNSLDTQTSMICITEDKSTSAAVLISLLNYVSIFVSIILGFLIIYANNFLIRRRKKELGIYTILGMSKNKVSIILVLETLFVGIISLLIGLVIGLGLSQILSVLVSKMFEANLSTYTFVFSTRAILKTLLYFSIIYVLVIIFNVIVLNKYKLINLFTASQKNEIIKVKKTWLIILTFSLGLALNICAYYILYSGILTNGNSIKMIIMFGFGGLGTFLLFYSISGFFLRLFQTRKKTYYKNLNMFVLKQINSKINTNVFSMTIISVLLLFTIGILSCSVSLTNTFNNDLTDNNQTDFTLYSNYTVFEETGLINGQVNFEDIIHEDTFNELIKEYVDFTLYSNPNITIESLITSSMRKQLIEKYGSSIELTSEMPIILESDYNNLMKLFNKNDLIFDLNNNEYILLCNLEELTNIYSDGLENNLPLIINNINLYPKFQNIISIALENDNSANNGGLLVISDNYKLYLTELESRLVGNYNGTDKANIEKQFKQFLLDNNVSSLLLKTKIDVLSSSTSLKILVSFIGLYLGLIFAITSATVLAISQLSEASDNTMRYTTLRKLGASDKMINKSLFAQIAVYFMFPLLIALLHSYFCLQEFNKLFKLLGNLNLGYNILIVTIFIVIVYGGYFTTTYICGRNIIKENNLLQLN